MITDLNANSSSNNLRQELLGIALTAIPVEGWNQSTFDWAVKQLNIDHITAKMTCPRGCMDLAVEFHRQGNLEMISTLENEDMTNLKFRDRVALAIWFRCLVVSSHQTALRRWLALYSLPNNLLEGSKLLWSTADEIWLYLGDRDNDMNWYTKRATLSTILASTALYMVHDKSESLSDTREFIERRIDDVMKFEKIKSMAQNSKALNPITNVFTNLTSRIRRPVSKKDNYPGWN